MSSSPVIFISAGEVSGDRHGAALVKALKKINPSLTFVGMGSEMMAQEGVKILADLTPYSTIGLLEPLLYLPRILNAYFKLKKALKIQKPEVFIAIDYQGFHMLLLKAVKALGIKTAYYIAPQEWQWGTEAGGKQVVALVDKILAIFPQEAQFYQRLGAEAVYVGNPVLDIAHNESLREEFCHTLQLDPLRPILGVFPGSRPQELRYTAPVLLEAAKKIQEKKPEVQIVVSIASSVYKQQIDALIKENGLVDFVILEGASYGLIRHSYLSLCTSGTVTLEHAVMGTPCLVGYKFSAFSYWLVTTLFKKKIARIKFMSLPNILLDKGVLPEFLQDQCHALALAEKALFFLEDAAAYEALKAEIQEVKQVMGSPGVVSRSAQEIASLL